MDDRVIFDHQGIIVSYSYLHVDQKQYPIENITGFIPSIIKPKYFLARLIMFSGLPLIFAETWYPLIGFSLMLLGLILFKFAKIQYALIIQTLNGAYNPIVSENLLEIENVAVALDVALAMRNSRTLTIGD